MRVPKEFIKSLQGKDFVLMGGLLELAHQDGLNYTHTDILQFPTQENGNTTIVRAIVRTGKGEFSGIGDASPASVPNKSIAVHSIRMAETRAVARALRVATNVSMTAFEELGGDIEVQAQPQAKPSNLKALPKPEKSSDSVVPMTDEQGKRIQFICKQIGMDGQTLNTTITAKYKHGWKYLTKQEADELIEQLSEFLDSDSVA